MLLNYLSCQCLKVINLVRRNNSLQLVLLIFNISSLRVLLLPYLVSRWIYLSVHNGISYKLQTTQNFIISNQSSSINESNRIAFGNLLRKSSLFESVNINLFKFICIRDANRLTIKFFYSQNRWLVVFLLLFFQILISLLILLSSFIFLRNLIQFYISCLRRPALYISFNFFNQFFVLRQALCVHLISSDFFQFNVQTNTTLQFWSSAFQISYIHLFSQLNV
ncbi:transmembrane protein, putative (macronuclear) [Tetrahymena thermophila SB210]|uniref:Transmembrane protein, putative n=1 Tax=Tetrahymena thermophila (strain SB210) TaxID=312017 RepID=W7XL72_TETTS|nr:transmembrane protein, putative [Tetrahymena thermophila SB210]EWS75784.1 transmembrane protein, putative [Tetrahymena thermophila SB210]|eukprot:XP_012651706.1 transmembrane protein, putative [Tetrahymena thermophila SB210]